IVYGAIYGSHLIASAATSVTNLYVIGLAKNGTWKSITALGFPTKSKPQEFRGRTRLGLFLAVDCRRKAGLRKGWLAMSGQAGEREARMAALREWEVDTGRPASTSEGIAFLDGYYAA